MAHNGQKACGSIALFSEGLPFLIFTVIPRCEDVAKLRCQVSPFGLRKSGSQPPATRTTHNFYFVLLEVVLLP